MKSHMIIALLALVAVGCVSENEQQGLDKIADLYQAKTSYSKSFDSNAGIKTMSKFNVKVSESERIDTLQPTVSTANIAMLMYESFTDSEKGDYTHIDVELISRKNDTAAYFYPIDVLKDLSTKSNSYKVFSESLVDGKFATVDEITDPKEIPNSIADGLKAKIKQMESRFGKLHGYESFGIAEISDEDGKAYQYQGYLVFGNGVRKPYFTVADAAKENDKLIGFRIF